MSPCAVNSGLMSSSKKGPGRPKKSQKEPTQNVGIPVSWNAVLKRLKAKLQRPKIWILIALLQEKAKVEGIPCPPAPWEEEDSEEPPDTP